MLAVGSNARCGSAVLISNERSMTSVPLAAARAAAPLWAEFAPYAATAAASAAIGTSAMRTTRPNRSPVTFTLLGREPASLLDVSFARELRGPLGRRGRRGVLALQPARRLAPLGDAQQAGLLARTPLEGVRAARVEAAAARRPRRVRHLPRERLGEEAGAVRVR